MYGPQALLSNDDEESLESSEDEDSEAELINPKFEKKFIETLAMIKSNDPKLKELG